MSKITEQRITLGLTQAQLADKIGVTQKDISRWETGARRPKVGALKRLSEALGCTIDDLVG